MEERDEFLETYSLPRLNQEKTENLNKPFISNEIESVIKNLPRSKIPVPDGFTDEFYETLKKELILILLKIFQ